MTLQQERPVLARPGARASFLSRAGSHLIDGVAPPLLVLGAVAVLVRTRHLLPALVVLVVGSLAWLVFTIWNSGVRQGRTGQSIGRSVMGTWLVGAATGRPIGCGRALVRQLAHLLDVVPLHVGYLWPLWDEQRQTFADKVCGTVVVRGGRPGP